MTLRRNPLLNTIIHMMLDFLFCWLSWMGSVYVFTYLFRQQYTALVSDVNSQVWVMAAGCFVFYNVCGVYKSLWAHPGVGSMLRVFAAVFLVSFAVYASIRVRMGFWYNPGLGMMAFYFLLTLSLSLRLSKKIFITLANYFRRFTSLPTSFPEEPVRTLVIGAGESASAFILRPSQYGGKPRKLLGILDNDMRKHGYSLHGVRIIGGDSRIPELVKHHSIDEIIVAVPSIKKEDLRRLIKLTPVNRCKVRLISGLSNDKASDMLREVSIADLLSRPETALDEQGISGWISGKTVLITGGGGSIGSEICRQLLNFNAGKIVIFDISENNAYNLKEELKVKYEKKGRYSVAVRIGSVQDARRLEEVFDEFKPQIVFHAAAYKHVPLMEECPRLAIDNNVRGTWHVTQCALRRGVERFVMISTDKAVNPTNVMGASKRMAELLVLGQNGRGSTEFVCVRFGNVLDSNGSVIPLFKRQIENGGPVTVTHPDIIRYFMTIQEAARLVLEAGAMANGGEIFILDMGEPVKIAVLAENLIRMAGLVPGVDVKIEYTGLRPGEKLYEELLLNEEGIAKTLNEKIFVVKPLCAGLGEIEPFLETGLAEGEDVRSFIKRFVPEYKNIDLGAPPQTPQGSFGPHSSLI
jgi:FlaA1/EpsC-like NDP-sugar epimerase